MKADQLLPETLALAVPLWIDEIRDWPPKYRCSRARECSRLMTESLHGGAELLWQVKPRGETATFFNLLALGIACCAYQPGGIRAFGMLWCARHLGAPATMEGGQVCSGCVEEEAS